ncbi:MAG: glycosyltransferase family 4 protein [Armatimonadota bacterium]
MNILLCNKFYRPFGGPETILFDCAREFTARGHNVIPFAMSHPDNVESPYSNYFVSNVDYNKKGSKSIKKLFKEAADLVYSKDARVQIEKLIAASHPDVAHAHNIYHQLSPSILVALKKAGVPTLLTFHDYKPLCANMNLLTHGKLCEKCAGRRFYHAVRNKCVKDSYVNSMLCFIEETLHRWIGTYERNVDLFISPSRFLKDMLVKYGRIPERQIRVLPNYANTKSVVPNFTPGSYGLFVGKIETFKGVGTLIEAAKQLPDFEIRLAGRGPYLEECQAKVTDSGQQNVNFLGFQTGDNLFRQLEESRFVIVPSEWYENCPMVVLEALAAGKPVIASKIGGIPELVNHGTDGLLFEPGNVDELAQCMKTLIDDPDKASEMGLAGRKKVEQHYSIENYISSTLNLYTELINRK